MKKTLLTLVATGFAVSAMAQGTINFGNYFQDANGNFTFLQALYGPNPGNPSESLHGSSAIDVPSGGTVYAGPLLQGTRYVVSLYGGPSSITDPALLTLVTSTTFLTDSGNNIPAGLFNPVGGTVAGAGANTIAHLDIRVTDLQNAGISGSTGIFNSGALGGSDANGNVFFPPDTTGWTSFNISGAAVPEPSTFALAGLGAAALLIFRRRK